MTGLVRLLGLAPAIKAKTALAAMARIEGPALSQYAIEGGTAFAQAEPGGPQRTASDLPLRLQQAQCRLEAACRAVPFVPAAAAAALCPAAELPALLAAAAPRLRLALAEQAHLQQWQLTLHWKTPRPLGDRTAEACATALREALRPALRVLRQQPTPSPEGGLHLLLLATRGNRTRIKTALRVLPSELAEGIRTTLLGPFSPTDFHAWRVVEAEERSMRAAWALLGQPEGVDTEVLQRRRLQLAPSGAGSEAAGMIAAYRRLAPLFAGAAETDLFTLLPRARRRLVPCEGHAA